MLKNQKDGLKMKKIRANKAAAKAAANVNYEKKVKTIIGVSLALIVLIALVLVVIESSLRCKFTLKNNTDKNITHIEVVIENQDEIDVLPLYAGSLPAGQSVSEKFEVVDFSEEPGSALWIYVEFENEKVLQIYDGYLYTKFDGRISAEFVQEDGEYRLNLDSGVGLFGSDEIAGIGSKIQLVFDEVDWHYMVYSRSEKKWIPDLDTEIDFSDFLDDEDSDDEIEYEFDD